MFAMNRLLLCLDGSQYADVCCRYAVWLAKHLSVQVHALYVSDLRQYEVPMFADLGGSLGAQPYQGLVSQIAQIEEEKSRLLGEAARRIFEEAGLEKQFSFEHRTGSLVDVVNELEEATVYDLVVLGKRGENADMASSHLGSAMERVVRGSVLPCFVSSREFFKIERVLVAYDGSIASRHAIEWLAVSPLFKDKSLHVVVVNDGHREDICLDHLSAAEDVLKSGGYEPVCQMLTGVVEQCIGDYVGDEQIHLLMMGAYGHSRLRELIIGSTTNHLLRECRIPVMMFR